MQVKGSRVATALLAVLQGEQQLGHRGALLFEQLLVGMRQTDLSDGGRCLLLLQRQHPLVEAELAPAQRHGARRNDDDLLAAPELASPHPGARVQVRPSSLISMCSTSSPSAGSVPALRATPGSHSTWPASSTNTGTRSRSLRGIRASLRSFFSFFDP